MYLAYGWPQSIPLDPDDSDRVVLLRVLGRLLLAVCPASLHLWSAAQHRVRLARFDRSPDSLAAHGQNAHAVWSPDAKTVAVLTSSFYLHIYRVHLSGKPLIVGGKQLPGLCLASISLIITEKVPLANGVAITSNFVCDSKSMLLGLSNGHVQVVSWNAEFSDSFKLGCSVCSSEKPTAVVDALVFDPPSFRENSNARPAPCCTGNSSIVHVELSVKLRLLVALYSGCHIALFTVGKKGLKQPGSIRVERWLNTDDAMCTSVASEQQILAVGCSRGVVELYDLAENMRHIRTISLYDWGYSVEDTGPVACISWTPDNCAFAVGWKFRGLTVWSVSGCRLMCTIRQTGSNSASSPMVKPNALKFEPLMGGTSHIQWDDNGYKLFAVEESLSERVLAFSFAKCCLNRGLSGTTYSHQVLYGDDRILLVQPDDADELKLLHLNVPVSYISQNWPVLHVVASNDGMYLAVAGSHGLVLYDLRNKRWRFFGDVTQEQKIQCKGLLWLGKIVIVCNYVESSNTYELLFFPKYHLDYSSLLYRKPLLGRPIVMDVFQDYVLVTYSPFDVHIFHVVILGELSPASNPVLQLSTVRELSIMSPKSPPVSMRFIPEQHDKGVLKQETNGSSGLSSEQPSRCLILRTNGELSVLDMDDGHEHALTNSVELFWVTCSQFEEKGSLIKEVSWLDYGHRGMQVWYPSHGADPFKQEDFLQLDPELEFDREVYPLGLLPNVGVVVGVSQRMSFSTAEFPCFEPSPQAQTILHCLLRHLLQRDKIEEALRLANLSAEKPHFSHCLEWLLFTVFDADISRPSASKNQVPQKVDYPKKSLLEKTCDLLRNFPEYMDVVVSVARKTDGRHWADLFSAAGRSTEMFEECFQRRWYRTAACYILVIAKLEGPAVSQYCALRLLQATLDESLYELAGELVRFLLRSGRDFENATSDSEKLSPRFLGYFLFRSPYKRQSSDLKSNSMKELSPHIASVMNILESHASYLMSGKELSKLVAFVKGTQFDLVEYLQRERLGSARLENFASALELIGQKLQMNTLQSRLDAEFLLAHMCSVKFKEWIVVLATLLRRAENINKIPINVESSGKKNYQLQDASVSKVSLSRNLQKLVLLCYGKLIDTENLSHNCETAGLHCLYLDTSIFFNRKNELHQVSQQASSIQNLVEVVRASISLISKQWSSAMNLFHEKFSALPNLIAAHGAESSSEDEFLSLLFGTRTSPALHQFLASSLGEAGLKRIAKAVDSAGREIRGVVSEHLQPAVEIISFRLAELRGLARWRSRFQIIGLDEKLMDRVTESIGMLVVQVERFSRVAATVLYLFQNFFTWVLKCVKILLNEPTDQVPAANSELVVIFLKFLLDKDPIKQLLEADERIECDMDTARHVEQLVVFGGFTDTQFLERSLVKQFNQLEDSLKEAFLMPFTTISSQIHCQGLLPLYPVTSDTFSSTCTPTSISFYKDEDSQHEDSSHNWTDYVCFKIPDGSLNERNCIGVIKDSGNCCTALSTSSLSGFLLHMPDEYECVDLSLYKDNQVVLLLSERSHSDSPGRSWMVMLQTQNVSFMPLSGTFPTNIYGLQKLVALDLQLDTDYGKVRSIPHTVSTPLAVSASRGVACVFSSRRHALVYILDEDEDEDEDGDEVSDME